MVARGNRPGGGEHMVEHPVFDVTFGLIFVYVILSLVCSAAQELVASLAGLRSRNLQAGIKNLVGNDLAKAVYGHRLVKGLSKKKRLPSYLSAKTFSTVLLEVVARDRTEKSYTDLTADELRGMIDDLPKDSPVRDVLAILVGSTQDEVEALKARVADWFDEGMERVSGWYRRNVKYWLLLIAAVIAVATNANTLHVVTALWEDSALRTVIAAQAETAASLADVTKIENAGEQLNTLPIGWTGGEDLGDLSWWLHSLAGWLLTMAAISLGAPFWFDLLGKVARLRASGGRPPPQTPPQTQPTS
jgi:hypothetical protein